MKTKAAAFAFVKLGNHRGLTVVKAKFRPAGAGKATNWTRRIRLVWRQG